MIGFEAEPVVGERVRIGGKSDEEKGARRVSGSDPDC